MGGGPEIRPKRLAGIPSRTQGVTAGKKEGRPPVQREAAFFCIKKSVLQPMRRFSYAPPKGTRGSSEERLLSRKLCQAFMAVLMSKITREMATALSHMPWSL